MGERERRGAVGVVGLLASGGVMRFPQKIYRYRSARSLQPQSIGT